MGFQKCAVGKLLDSLRAFYEFTARQDRFVFVHLQQLGGEDGSSFSPLRVVGESIVCMFKVKRIHLGQSVTVARAVLKDAATHATDIDLSLGRST